MMKVERETLTCSDSVSSLAAPEPVFFSQFWTSAGRNTVELPSGDIISVRLTEILIYWRVIVCHSYLDSRSYFTDVISNVLLPSSFKRDFGTHETHKDTNLVLCLVYLVIVPTENWQANFFGLIILACGFFHNERSKQLTKQKQKQSKTTKAVSRSNSLEVLLLHQIVSCTRE